MSVEPGRIEVRFSGAKDAVGRLFALAQALTNDYERFEELGRERGEVFGMSETLMPTVARPEIARPGTAVALPAVIVDAGPAAVERFLEFGLKTQAGEPLATELDAAKRHIGELSMESELLRECARAAERRLPVATRSDDERNDLRDGGAALWSRAGEVSRDIEGRRTSEHAIDGS